LLDVPEWAAYAAFLREDFDELEVGSGGLFKNFLAGVKKVLMEIVEGVVARECVSAVEYMGERLRRFINVDRLDERDRDGRPLLMWVLGGANLSREGVCEEDGAGVCSGLLCSEGDYRDECRNRTVP